MNNRRIKDLRESMLVEAQAQYRALDDLACAGEELYLAVKNILTLDASEHESALKGVLGEYDAILANASNASYSSATNQGVFLLMNNYVAQDDTPCVG